MQIPRGAERALEIISGGRIIFEEQPVSHVIAEEGPREFASDMAVSSLFSGGPIGEDRLDYVTRALRDALYDKTRPLHQARSVVIKGPGSIRFRLSRRSQRIR